MVIAGGVLIATGVGGPAGMMLVSAGADTIIQKATTGHVNWGQVAVAGVAGGVGFGAGSLATRAGLTGLRGAMAVGAAGGAAEGGVYGGGSYLTGPGPHTVNGLLTHTAVGTAAGGVLGGAGGAAGHGLSTIGGRLLGSRNPFATAPDEAVFWSGIRGGDTSATAWVGKNGGATLETTMSSRGIELPAYDRNVPSSVEAWQNASAQFAEGARGSVRVLQEDGVRIQSIWATKEYGALTSNPDVTSITAVDPRTNVETPLWSR